MTPIQLNHPEAVLELNQQLGMAAKMERTTAKVLILEGLKLRVPELADIINKELARSKR